MQGLCSIPPGASDRRCSYMRRLHLVDSKVVRKRKLGECRDMGYSALALKGWKDNEWKGLLLRPAVGNESENE